MRYHLDECCDNAVAEGLRHRGVDVTTSPEVGLRAASDEEQLNHASVHGRILVTKDADFVRLHRSGISHAGIAYFLPSRSIGQVIRGLLLLPERFSPQEMRNRIEFI
jgi:hypothetical protein